MSTVEFFFFTKADSVIKELKVKNISPSEGHWESI